MSPEDIDNLNEKIKHRNITVAIGDSKYIFQVPNIITYSLDYISDKDEIGTEIRLRFAASQRRTDRFPVHKILKREIIEKSNLHPSEKDKLKQRFSKYSNFESHYNSISKSSVFDVEDISVRGIIDKDIKKEKIYETLAIHINNLDLNEVKKFLVKELEELKDKGEIKICTELRRLMLLYDILKYKGDNV